MWEVINYLLVIIIDIRLLDKVYAFYNLSMAKNSTMRVISYLIRVINKKEWVKPMVI